MSAGTTPPGAPRLSVASVNNSQTSLSETLLEELTAACLDPKYDNMTIATLLGVVVLLTDNMLQRHRS